MKAQELRDAIVDEELLLLPSVNDALSAKLAESVGHQAVYLGGNNTGASTAATEPMITMTEMCDRARQITHNVDAPLVVDGHAGFGDASHTYRAVQEYAKTGIAGIHIEDQVNPKRLHYHAGFHNIVSQEEMEFKVEAAIQAREEMADDIVIMARSDAGRGDRRGEGETIEDAVNRCNSYLEAGADAAMLFPDNVEEVRYAGKNIAGPLAFPMVEYILDYCHDMSLEEISTMGYDFVVYPLSAMIVTTRALRELYESILDDGSMITPQQEAEETHEEIKSLIDLPKFYELEEQGGKK